VRFGKFGSCRETTDVSTVEEAEDVLGGPYRAFDERTLAKIGRVELAHDRVESDGRRPTGSRRRCHGLGRGERRELCGSVTIGLRRMDFDADRTERLGQEVAGYRMTGIRVVDSAPETTNGGRRLIFRRDWSLRVHAIGARATDALGEGDRGSRDLQCSEGEGAVKGVLSRDACSMFDSGAEPGA